ncbi:acetyltransferase family protein [Collimonas arenae]|uniref:Acetyltransferase family protein n=1 Tax=Collimonas arenae TaxID=279058 RepID=A0A127PQM8_9BURK|nr:GNAT family N-acetyltransferase [Collimonas arenae]AMP00049.1 acetyltransferase family protein [Collimonas arenae]AMP09945.1 acetyltransferase family protein [Collimonas arenae]
MTDPGPGHGALPAFPAGAALESPTALQQRGIRLRPCAAGDISFLTSLYRQLRAAELAPLPWPDAQKHAFIDSQFALQHRHYLTHYPNADFLLIECNGEPIGRLYLSRQMPEFLIIDISLAPGWRNSGIGTALIRHAQTLAENAGAGLNLHVEQRNDAARKLYDRLGFIATDTEGFHTGMRWPASTGTQNKQEIQSKQAS